MKITHHDDAVEGEPRFGAVPGNELVDAELVYAARTRRGEPIEHALLECSRSGRRRTLRR